MLSHQGSPEIKEHYIDSKKDVDRHLKSSCEHFIQQQTHMFVGNLEEFLSKVKFHSFVSNEVKACFQFSY